MKLMFTAALIAITIIGCKKEDSSPAAATTTQTITTEAQLYILGKSDVGYVYYMNSTDTIGKDAGSGHSEPKLRTRYNTIAASYLDAAGRVKAGTVFRDSSLIVKELYDNRTLSTYVFLFKKSGDKNADANGWVWAETSPTGTSKYPAANKGAGCIGCHSIGIDYTRMNDAHP